MSISSPIFEHVGPGDAYNFRIGMSIDGWFDANGRMRYGAMPWRKGFAGKLAMALGWRHSLRVTAVDVESGTITMDALR